MPKKKYSPEEMTSMFENYMWRKCKCNTKEVADLLSCSQVMARKMLSGERAPNAKALEMMGFMKVKETWFERI